MHYEHFLSSTFVLRLYSYSQNHLRTLKITLFRSKRLSLSLKLTLFYNLIYLDQTKHRLIDLDKTTFSDNYVLQWWIEFDNELSWLFTKSASKQPTQLIVQLNSSLQHIIIVTLKLSWVCKNTFPAAIKVCINQTLP